MKVNLAEKFARITDHWTPRIVAELNGQHVKLAKVRGEFVWHDHAAEDELFLVVRGTLVIDFRDRPAVELGPGELCVVPRGVEHRPYTRDGAEVELLLLEPAGIAHTGGVADARTVKDYEWL